MRRNRLLLCFLLGIAIVFYGVPYLNFQGDIKTVIFSIVWLLFALIAISGNMIALLYGKRVDRSGTMRQKVSTQRKQKVRQYG
jgi:type IV secretory pathway VirB3-like protein